MPSYSREPTRRGKVGDTRSPASISGRRPAAGHQQPLEPAAGRYPVAVQPQALPAAPKVLLRLHPHTCFSPLRGNRWAWVTSCTLTGVTLMLWTIPVSASTPMCSFIPKMTTPSRPNEFVVTTQFRVRQGKSGMAPKTTSGWSSPIWASSSTASPWWSCKPSRLPCCTFGSPGRCASCAATRRMARSGRAGALLSCNTTTCRAWPTAGLRQLAPP